MDYRESTRIDVDFSFVNPVLSKCSHQTPSSSLRPYHTKLLRTDKKIEIRYGAGSVKKTVKVPFTFVLTGEEPSRHWHPEYTRLTVDVRVEIVQPSEARETSNVSLEEDVVGERPTN